MSIASMAVSGAAWNLAVAVASRVIGLVGTLILTRFIAPAEYGEVSAAFITVAMAMTLSDASVAASIVARPARPDVCFHALVLHVASGIAAVVPVLLLSRRIGLAFDAPEMARFVPGIAIAAVLDRVSHVPGRVLMREMRFRTFALTRGTGELVFTGVSVALAASLHGDALVIGNFARSAILAVVFVTRVDRREWLVPQPLRWSVVKDLFSFGGPLWVGGIASFASSSWDNLLVGRYFGPSAMGTYRLARSLSDTPSTHVAEQIGDVLLPSFAKMDRERRRAALPRAVSIMALIVFPLSVGLAATAPTIAQTLLDRRWAGLGPMLMVLSSLAIVRPLSWVLVSFHTAQEKTRRLMLLPYLQIGVMLLLVLTVGRLGPSWTCLGVGMAGVVGCAASLLMAVRSDGVSARRFVAAALGPMIACAPMFAAVTALRHALAWFGAGPTLASLAAETAVGAVTYLAAARWVARPAVDDALGMVRSALRRAIEARGASRRAVPGGGFTS